MSLKPLVSVITVCYQAELTLAETLQSVRKQSYPYLEHIVIDGGSIDRTLDVLRENHHPRLTWYSGPDHGMYDAMNRGIARAAGEWIILLNADDLFSEPNSLESAMHGIEHLNPSLCIHYFDFCMFEAGHMNPVLVRAYLDLRRGMTLCHQAMIYHRSVFAAVGGFLEGYRLAGDLDHTIRCLDAGVAFVHHDQALVHFRIGGASSKQGKRYLTESAPLIHRRFGWYWALRLRFNYLLGRMRGLFGKLLSRRLRGRIRYLMIRVAQWSQRSPQ